MKEKIAEVLLFEGLQLLQRNIYQKQQMQQQEVLELIETVVRPLQDRIEHLEKQNEELRTQMNTLLTQRSEPNRLRSSSREEHRIIKKEECSDTRSPSQKKKDEKPHWNYGKVNKQEKGIYKSPPPVDKKIYKPSPARVSNRPESKEKNTRASNQKPHPQKKESVQYLSFQKQAEEPKKIIGGQKFSEQGSAKEDPNLKENSLMKGKNNPESNPSQDISSRGGSHLARQEGQNQEES